MPADDFLAWEAERTLYEYCYAWEGEREEVIDCGDALLHLRPVPWYGIHGLLGRARLDPAGLDERIEALAEQAGAGGRLVQWIAGRSTRPPYLPKRLLAHGFRVKTDWAGLALRDLAVEIPTNPQVRIEPLSADNAQEYAELTAACECDPQVREERLAAAGRYLRQSRHEVQIVIARLEGRPAAYAVLRLEPSGVAYLRQATTLPEYRRRGLYLTLVAHRLALARAAGCSAAVIQAQQHSSAPILRKRGFADVCRIFALIRPPAAGGS